MQLLVKVKAHVMVHPGSSALSESDSPCSSRVVPVRSTQCERLLVWCNGVDPARLVHGVN